MFNTAALLTPFEHAGRFDAFAQKAKRIGDSRLHQPAEYWYGRAFGFETAADEIRAFLDDIAAPPDRDALLRLANRLGALALEGRTKADGYERARREWRAETGVGVDERENAPDMYAYWFGAAETLEIAAGELRQIARTVKGNGHGGNG